MHSRCLRRRCSRCRCPRTRPARARWRGRRGWWTSGTPKTGVWFVSRRCSARGLMENVLKILTILINILSFTICLYLLHIKYHFFMRIGAGRGAWAQERMAPTWDNEIFLIFIILRNEEKRGVVSSATQHAMSPECVEKLRTEMS